MLRSRATTYALDCVVKFYSNSTCKFADDSTVVSKISNNNEAEYRKGVKSLVAWWLQ